LQSAEQQFQNHAKTPKWPVNTCFGKMSGGDWLFGKIDLPIAIFKPSYRRTPSIRSPDARHKNLANIYLPSTAGRDP
jgi:hypothetical protein